jgi:hypothetical protein
MSLAAMPTLLIAALLDSPALYQAFVQHDMDYTTALTRYLIAVVIAAIMVSMLKGLSSGWLRANEAAKTADQAEAAEPNPARRSTDAP